MKKTLDTVKLYVGHNLILGNKPAIVAIDVLNKIIEEDGHQEIAKFGLFESSSPNYTTYYPEVSAEDLTPKDEDFIYPLYRALSNVTVMPNYNPIHFSEEVLKRNMYKLIGQTVNIDHETAVGNAIGTVLKAEWQGAYKTKDGVKVPAGINTELKIDGKSNPRIARGINMEPPSIHSTSVTVTFAWEKSHPNMGDEEFWNKLGTFDKEGKLVQRVVTDIQAFHEISLVSHGADRFAQKIGKDGKIVNPQYSKSTYPLSDSSFSAEELTEIKKGNKQYYYDFKEMSTESFSEETTILEDNNNIQTISNMDILKLIAAIFGVELTEENYQASLTALKDELANLREAKEKETPITIGTFSGVDAITAELGRLTNEVATLTQKLQTQTADVELATTLVNEVRVDALRLYRASLGEKPEDTNIVNLINTSSYATLKSLHTQYDELTDKQFQFHCGECGSTNVTRLTAKPGENSENDKKDKKSASDAIEHFTGVPENIDTKFIQ